MSGSTGPKANLVRFILSPDGLVTPDFSERFPGRGAWVSASRQAIEKAVAADAFSRAFRQKAMVPADLPSIVEAGLLRAALAALGLARRAGNVVTGFEKTRKATEGRKEIVLVLANDAAADGRRKFKSLGVAARRAELFSRGELSAALGQADVVFAAIFEGPHTARFVEAMEKLAGFREIPAK